ncbi:S1/P1 nuclease [Polaromonas aquatica]|uniref:S1/P1 nuclease n=1 Tax=Polaromonas aquatica TaxID=332657 RepID=A0ABW1U5T6_9BURK
MSLLPLWLHAWGATGHQVIGVLAEKQLGDKARIQVQRLLDLEPGSTLSSISTWADEHKNPTTARWHFLNFPRTSCSYGQSRDCPDGNCILGAIDRQVALLKSQAPQQAKLLALKYLIHFIGDLHQPLHLGYMDDKGGNLYQIQAYKKGSNLHSLWDSGLIRFISDDPQVWTDRLVHKPIPARVNLIDPVRVAEESCRIVATPGFYPDRKVGAAYVDRWTSVLEQQMVLAGARLARTLNGLWP